MGDDFYRPTCPECGEPMQSDSDGDGVMTMSYEFCEHCGEKDYGEPVRVTEELFAFARREGLMPN